MKHTLHHLRWLLRRFRLPLACYLAAWALVFVAVWLVPGSGKLYFYANDLFLALHWILPVVAMLMLLEALWQDAAPGTREFWRTRPPRWRAVWGSQVIFLTVFLAGPPLLGWLVNGLLLHSTAMQWRYGAVDALLIPGPLLALAGIVSFSRGWYSLLLSMVAAAGCVIGGVMLARIGPGVFGLAYLLAGGGIILAVSWAFGMRLPGLRWRAGLTGIALLLAPLLVPRTGSAENDESRTTLTLKVNDPESIRPNSEETDPDGLLLHGVPEFAEAVVTRSSLRMMKIASPDYEDGRQLNDLQPAPRWMGLFTPRHRYDSIPRKGLRALFPDGIRWYTHIKQEKTHIDLLEYFQGRRLTEPEASFRVAGTAEGYLVTAERLTAVPLEAGAVAAENGTRALLRELRVSAEGLALRAEVWSAGCVDEPVPPRGVMNKQDFFTHRYLPVLYFPTVPMAILLDDRPSWQHGWSEFRSWQCVNRSLSLGAALPTAEAIRGIRFTPDVMRGAQLVLCVPLIAGHFTVGAPRGVQTIAQRSRADDEEEKMERLFVELSHGYARNGKQIPPPAITELRPMGGPAVRAMLRRPWDRYGPLNEPEKFMDLWQGWLTDEFLPDLAQAMQRDQRWMRVAWINGQAEKLADPALDMVRHTHAPLSLWIVAAAASNAGTADYDLLRHHAVLAGRNHDGESGLDKAITLLWQRLRALPGFPWRELAREQWQALRNDDRDQHGCEGLRTAAALAGDASALNALLELERRNEHSEFNTLNAEEWTSLAAMIDDIPPEEPGRTKWLRDNRGLFIWDAARERYAVKK